jgi:hypothetical protein
MIHFMISTNWLGQETSMIFKPAMLLKKRLSSLPMWVAPFTWVSRFAAVARKVRSRPCPSLSQLPASSIASRRSWWLTAMRLRTFQSKKGQNVLTHAFEPRAAKDSPMHIMLASAIPALMARFWSTVPTPACSPLVDARSESTETTLESLANRVMHALTTSDAMIFASMP